jgi:putative DNA-invertase from lambdoid prophage Rac
MRIGEPMKRQLRAGVPAALYHRVSTLDQDPTLARRELRAAARARGLRVVLDIEETGSGANNDRPGLQEVLAAARRGHVRAVLVWKLDRWGRGALDVAANVQALVDAGAGFSAISQGLDVRPGGDAISRLLLQVLAAVAEFERELIRERTRAGIAKARERGTRLGRPPVEVDVAGARKSMAGGASLRAAARAQRISPSTLSTRLRAEKGAAT